MEQITSKQNPRIRNLLRLHSSRGRQRQNRIAVFGSREIIRALRSGVEPDELLVCHELVEPATLSNIKSLVSDFSCAKAIDRELFSKVCFGNRDDGIIMTANRPEQSMERVLQNADASNSLISVVESIEKPGNLGAILRSADGAGVDGVIVADPMTDWFHPNSIRSSLGTCFSISGCDSESDSVRRSLNDHGFQIVVASLDGAIDFYDVDFSKKSAIVLGNEAHGVSAAWKQEDCIAAKLPMNGIADSLNVSVAAAVMFYEAARQRRAEKRNY